MFKNKDKKNDAGEDELAAKVSQDLIVRNMPVMRPSVTPPASSQAGSFATESDNLSAGLSAAKSNSKAVGLAIIAGGLIVVAGLVYLSYSFIIKPQTGKSTTPATIPAPSTGETVNAPIATTTVETVIASTSPVATVTPMIFDSASSSASSTVAGETISTLGNEVPPLTDADDDGLYDEEETVLGTNPDSADSNGNSYPDLIEVENNYNPAGTGRLSADQNLAAYADKASGYSILYPKNWETGILEEGGLAVFTAPDGSIIQVSVQENSDKQSILGWYGNSFPDVTITYDKLKTEDSWDGIYGSDNLNFYITDKKRTNIYIFSYIPAIDGRLAYEHIFAMMIGSMSVK